MIRLSQMPESFPAQPQNLFEALDVLSRDENASKWKFSCPQGLELDNLSVNEAKFFRENVVNELIVVKLETLFLIAASSNNFALIEHKKDFASLSKAPTPLGGPGHERLSGLRKLN